MPRINEEEFVDKKVDFRMWGKIIRYAKPFYKYIFLVFFFMSASSLCDVLNPLIMSHLIDHNLIPRAWAGAPLYMALYVAVVFFQITTTYGFIRSANAVELGLTTRLRRLAFDKLQTLSFSYYDKTPVGYIMSRLTSDAQRLSDTIAWSCVDIFWSVVFMITAAVIMLFTNWRLALMLIATTPFIAVISYFFQKVILKNYRLVRSANSKITGAFNEGIMGAKTTKTLVQEEANNKEFYGLTENMQTHSVKAAVFSAIYWPIIMTIGSIGTGLILWQGGSNVLAGAITLGEFNFFMTLGGYFFEPINNLARIFAEVQSAQAAVERVITLMDTPSDIQDTPEVVEMFGDEFVGKTENWPQLHGDVEFKDVTFKYKDGQTVLRNFSLKIKQGERIALVGETGSGKSTIVNLICRFYEPTEGVIEIDGVDYRERSQLWLHSNLGYVLQSPQLFSGTIRENIRYGRLDATDEEVEAVAEMVDAASFINRLEKGYETEVGEGGGRLSTGEKQLISFARAILANPAIFVLDEATSSIDTETEAMIQRAIERVLDGRTSFIIAHRLSTIRSCDRILVIDKGEVVEAGNHHQLMALGGRYYNLYTTQFKNERETETLSILGVKRENEE
ncbi:MAG: ABC transporter ATP-binding protein [Clostridia bacterium]|nr:ABC transporter ATP-binding protein [Clostridia bacterium]